MKSKFWVDFDKDKAEWGVRSDNHELTMGGAYVVYSGGADDMDYRRMLRLANYLSMGEELSRLSPDRLDKTSQSQDSRGSEKS